MANFSILKHIYKILFVSFLIAYNSFIEIHFIKNYLTTNIIIQLKNKRKNLLINEVIEFLLEVFRFLGNLRCDCDKMEEKILTEEIAKGIFIWGTRKLKFSVARTF